MTNDDAAQSEDADLLLARARARAHLHDWRHPVVLVELVGVRKDPETGRSSPNRDFRRAWIEGTDKKFIRNEGESLEVFQLRVIGEAPIGPTSIVFAL